MVLVAAKRVVVVLAKAAVSVVVLEDRRENGKERLDYLSFSLPFFFRVFFIVFSF